MTTNYIRVDYEALRNLGADFDLSSEETQTILRKLQSRMHDLRLGGWIGDGANVFYSEMDESMFPSMLRLANVLHESNRIIEEIISIFQLAEEEASALFTTGNAHGVSSPGVFEDVRDLYEILFNPTTIERTVERLRSIEAGKQLGERLSEAGITLRFPDGSTMGAENGTVIDVEYENTDISDTLSVGGFYNSGPPPRLVVSNERMSTTDLASIIGHESIHALDDAHHNLNYDAQVLDEPLHPEDFSDPTFRAQLEQDISGSVQTKINSEIRAYEMSAAVQENRPYADDGVNTNEEVLEVFTNHRYEAYYEEAYSKYLSEQAGHPVEVDISYSNGSFTTRVVVSGAGGGGEAGSF